MSKKSSKTSHVLNLLTNRTGALIQDSEADNDKTQTQTVLPVGGDSPCNDSSVSEPISNSGSGGGVPLNSSASGGDSSHRKLSSGGSSDSDSVVSNLSGGKPLYRDSFGSDLSDNEPAGRNSSHGQTDELPNPVLVEIAAPVRVAVSNPIIAELTRDYPLSSVSVIPGGNAESNGHNVHEKTQRKDPSVADLIRTELERNYQNEQQTLSQEALAASLDQQTLSQEALAASLEQPILPETPQPSAECQVNTEDGTAPPHVEEFTPDEFLTDEFPETEKTKEMGASERIGNEKETGDSERIENEKETGASERIGNERETGDSERIGNERETETAKEADDSFQPCYINVMDEIVRSNVMPIMESMEMCTCSRCVNDVVALALNLLPPKYVVTEKGSLYAKVSLYEGQHQVDVFTSITKACLEVKNSPRHHCSS